MKKLTAVVLFFCLALAFASCSNGFEEILYEDTEKIEVWCLKNGEHISKEVNENARREILKLYNEAEYAGDDDGVGTTPEMGISIYTDGKIVSINLFNSEKFEVYNEGRRFYIKSPVLKEILSRLV